MKEHRCPKCNKLLFKYSDYMVQGMLKVETQHHCRSEDNTKVKDVKVFDKNWTFLVSSETKNHI